MSILRGFVLVSCLACGLQPQRFQAQPSSPTDESIQARVAIEKVLWKHRTWPKDNPTLKPAFEALFSRESIQELVTRDLRQESAKSSSAPSALGHEAVQAEIDRLVKDTKDPRLLKEIFEALGNNPREIAEYLVKPLLAARLSEAAGHQEGLAAKSSESLNTEPFFLPNIVDSQEQACVDRWDALPVTASTPTAREKHSAVWTGVEMIVWGGLNGTSDLQSGARYFPVYDAWLPTSVGPGCPTGRYNHSAVWTGSEMIIWGGHHGGGGPSQEYNTGARYTPVFDSWTPTSTGSNCPAPRNGFAYAWTGTEMIVWGGNYYVNENQYFLNSGGRYSPDSDTWASTTTLGSCPTARSTRAVWTGQAFLVWGGYGPGSAFGDGAFYFPASNSWLSIPSDTNTPSPRGGHLAAWTGTEFIVWGGSGYSTPDGQFKNTGGIFDPRTGEWRATSLGAGCPEARDFFQPQDAWTGSEFWVWGGRIAPGEYTNTGGRYDLALDQWTPILTDSSCPQERFLETTVSCGDRTIVWGGNDQVHSLNSGASYLTSPQIVACEAVSTTESGQAPLTVGFVASAVQLGCSDEPIFQWSFGDGGTASAHKVAHTYATAGTYQWQMQVVSNGVGCTQTGSIVVTSPCALTCSASALPTQGAAPLTVAFTAQASEVGCTGSLTNFWDFGDGLGSDLLSVSHSYSTPGIYTWRFYSFMEDQVCQHAGTISVTVMPPQVTGVTRGANPFKITINGSNFQTGITVAIAGSPWDAFTLKNPGQLVLKGGSSLKARFPAGQFVRIDLRNPDGGTVAVEYERTSNQWRIVS